MVRKILQTTTGDTNSRYAWIYKAIVFLLMALYLVSCFTPLRLEYDSVRYFAIKDCLDAGCAPDSRAAKDFLPNGYPVLLLLLSKLGLLKSFFIAFINGIYLLGSLYFIKKIIAPANQYFLFFIVAMLHWTFIKLFAYPLSEMQYLFFSSASLYFYNRYGQSRNWLFLVLAFAFAILSMLTRTVGIALIATLFAGFVWKNRKVFNSRANQLRIFIAVALSIVAAFFAFTKMPELKHYIDAFSTSGLRNSYRAGMTTGHFKEWGQLLLNVPISKIENYFPTVIVSFVFIAAGIVFFLWFVYKVFKMRNSISGTVIIYLILYIVIIFNWPYFDPRFWVPILPFIIAITLQSSFDKIKLPKVLTPFFLAIYFSMGIFAFGYSLYTEFDKKTFARAQAKGIFRNEYETHFFGKPLSDTAKHVNKDVIELLEKYDK